jgi:hypothetical protein
MSELMGGMTSMISASLGALVYLRVRPRGHEVGCERLNPDKVVLGDTFVG